MLKKILILLAVTCLSGCFSSNPEDILAFTKPNEVDTTTDTYILQPPDEVLVSCTDVPAIHEQRQEIGEFQAAGKTPEQLAEDIRVKTIDYYKLTSDYPVDVKISSFKSKVFYVLGQVNDPGPMIYTGRDTLLTALSIAEPNPMAWLDRVQVIRPSADENVKPAIFELDYDHMIVHGDTTKNVLLQEGDIIYVPPTVLGWLALKIEEFIRPVARAFSGVYTVRRGIDSDNRYY